MQSMPPVIDAFEAARRESVYLITAFPGGDPLPLPPLGVPWLVVVAGDAAAGVGSPDDFGPDLGLVLKRCAGFSLCSRHTFTSAARRMVEIAADRQHGLVLVQTSAVQRVAWFRFIRQLAPAVPFLDPLGDQEAAPPDPDDAGPPAVKVNRHMRRVQARLRRQQQRHQRATQIP